MNNKTFFRLGFVCVIIFVFIASYFWYLYFHEGEGNTLDKNVALEFINSGYIDYINADINDAKEVIPVYYFSVKNNIDKEFSYDIVINQVSPQEKGDGCTEATTFLEDELMYELKLDNRVIKTGVVSDIENHILDSNKISGNTTNNYSFRIWLSENAKDYQNKHYHYVIDFKEK